MKISVLGSTGSIGVQALEVAEKLGYSVCALAAGGERLELLEQQARKFNPQLVAVFCEEAAKALKLKLADTEIKVLGGAAAVEQAAALPCSRVLNAVVGIAGLRPTLAAIAAGNSLALANKESLVTGGELVMPAVTQKGLKLYPVDSEHSAIFQSLQGVPQGTDYKIILTASGGPFFNKKRDFLKTVTPEMALKHPNWAMGKKISIDSATLMNKGLEVIEAVHLFGVSPAQIQVVVHRQSIIHSAVELPDGAVIAQLGSADMRIPIQYAFTYPNRVACPAKPLSLTAVGQMTFEQPDEETFVCLPACKQAIARGGLYPAAVNGANERAVELFLQGRIGFLQIGEIVSAALSADFSGSVTVQRIFEVDSAARALANRVAGV